MWREADLEVHRLTAASLRDTGQPVTEIQTARRREHAHALQYRMAILNLLRSDPELGGIIAPGVDSLPLPRHELEAAE
ncbi:hypothetical protein HN018_01380 [Lichenicola cladoniae]|uniref:Uncharacterized protein n=1 Tax=Lichenicola cladoniae TaxID=1484109 RepID=A0A6M8HGX6_9PROT|nr:hypothetical protein [Lichenicola cladoniae]NPD65297.1 hypothetical protein [Acetobacteraceae bacterium]QKE88882.1 hypothetical protein HN018_01380 [Lichenicola cladoniae]